MIEMKAHTYIYIYKAQKEAKSEDFHMELIVFPESSATGKNPSTDNSGIKAK
jgi:predicted amidohydrolase